MASSTDARYRLVVFDELDDPQLVRDLFAKVTGTHPTDAMQWVAKVPGVWPKPLDETETRALLDGLYELEVAAEAWRLDKFPDLGTPRTIHDAACLDNGFRVKGLRGEPTHWVPWDKVEMICAGRIAASDEFRDVQPPSWVSAVGNGFRAMIGQGPRHPRRYRASRIPRDPVGEVLIVRSEPRVTFRVVETKMNYSYLGDRLKEHAAENFPLFLGDLIAHSKKAYLTRSTRSMTHNGDPESFEFADSTALLDYATHRLLWSWYRRDRDKAWNPATDDDD